MRKQKKKQKKFIFSGLLAGMFLLGLLFPLEQVYAQFSNGLSYCREMTMTAGAGGVATTTTNGFALVATSTISTLAATSSAGKVEKLDATNSYPFDVIFTDGTNCQTDEGTVVDFFFEEYASTTGEFVAWIEANDISSAQSKTVLMYYGDADATDQTDKAGTFGALGEISVYTMEETPTGDAGDIKDALGTNNGTSLGLAAATGNLDGALDFGGGSSDRVDIGTWANTADQMTLMLWINVNSVTSRDDRYISKADGTASANHDWMLGYSSGSSVFRARWNRIDGTCFATVGPDTGSWDHVVSTYSNGSAFIYEDGSNVTSGTCTHGSGGLPNNTNDVHVGNQPGTGGGAHAPDAQIDDVRFYSRALHANDILTIYNNTVNSARFWTIGEEESQATQVEFEQSGYRIYLNVDSTDVGASSLLNTASIVPSQGTPFRLRMLLHNASTTPLGQSGDNLKLQYAVRSGECDAGFSDESYSDVAAGSGAIRFYDNTTPANAATLTENTNDPIHSNHTINAQTYQEQNPFTNSVSTVGSGEDALWDFALVDNSAPAGTTYCLRIVYDTGTLLDSYDVIPQITTNAREKVRLRGGVRLRTVRI